MEEIKRKKFKGGRKGGQKEGYVNIERMVERRGND